MILSRRRAEKLTRDVVNESYKRWNTYVLCIRDTGQRAQLKAGCDVTTNDGVRSRDLRQVAWDNLKRA
jgi:hypothetical protein